MRKTALFPPSVDISAGFASGAIVTEPNSEAPLPYGDVSPSNYTSCYYLQIYTKVKAQAIVCLCHFVYGADLIVLFHHRGLCMF